MKNNKFIISRDDFNSNIFEVEFGNISEINNLTNFLYLENIVKKSVYDFLSLRINVGFYLVATLVTYEFDFLSTLVGKQKKDLLLIASNSFIKDRYHSDPNIPNFKSDLYYKSWLNICFNGLICDVMATIFQDKVVGFILYNINDFNNETPQLFLI